MCYGWTYPIFLNWIPWKEYNGSAYLGFYARERVFCLNPTVKYRSTLNAIRLGEHNTRRPLCFHCVTFNTHASAYTWYVKQVNTAVNIYIYVYHIIFYCLTSVLDNSLIFVFKKNGGTNYNETSQSALRFCRPNIFILLSTLNLALVFNINSDRWFFSYFYEVKIFAFQHTHRYGVIRWK